VVGRAREDGTRGCMGDMGHRRARQCTRPVFFPYETPQHTAKNQHERKNDTEGGPDPEAKLYTVVLLVGHRTLGTEKPSCRRDLTSCVVCARTRVGVGAPRARCRRPSTTGTREQEKAEAASPLFAARTTKHRSALPDDWIEAHRANK
jgi:hypothetical protein